MVSAVNRSTTSYQGNIVLKSPTELFKNTDTQRQPAYNNDNFELSSKIGDAAKYGIGALSGYKHHGVIVEAGKNFGNSLLKGGAKDLFGSIGSGVKSIGGTAVNAAGVGAIIGGGVSLATNIYGVATGKESVKGATANVVTDTMGSALSATAGVAVGGLTALTLNAFKVTGTPVMIAGVLGGAVGAALVDKVVDFDSLNQRIRNF